MSAPLQNHIDRFCSRWFEIRAGGGYSRISYRSSALSVMSAPGLVGTPR